jgi:hypothetical protein
VRRGAEFLYFHRQHHLNNLRVCVALLLVCGAGADVKHRPTARVPHQLLSYLDVDTKCSQIRRKRMAEAVPANLFAYNGRRR